MYKSYREEYLLLSSIVRVKYIRSIKITGKSISY